MWTIYKADLYNLRACGTRGRKPRVRLDYLKPRVSQNTDKEAFEHPKLKFSPMDSKTAVQITLKSSQLAGGLGWGGREKRCLVWDASYVYY